MVPAVPQIVTITPGLLDIHTYCTVSLRHAVGAYHFVTVRPADQNTDRKMSFVFHPDELSGGVLHICMWRWPAAASH